MADEQTTEKRLAISKIYLKDFSFESPQTPHVFRQSDWQPKTDLNLRSSNTLVEEGIHEVLLTVTVEAKADDKTIFLVELQQAGLFEISGYGEEELGAIVGSFCPNILFPYVRETIASLIQKGGFPEFVLQPINFDALYVQSQQQKVAAQAEVQETH